MSIKIFTVERIIRESNFSDLGLRTLSDAQRFSGLRAGGLKAVRPFFSFFFFPPA